jgi:hypothetical protein
MKHDRINEALDDLEMECLEFIPDGTPALAEVYQARLRALRKARRGRGFGAFTHAVLVGYHEEQARLADSMAGSYFKDERDIYLANFRAARALAHLLKEE